MRTRRPALVLLVVMILVAGLLSAAERDRSSGDRDPATTSALPAAAAEERGREVVAKLPARAPVRARVGDTVVLRVRSETPDIAKMLQLGLQTSVGPGLAGELRFVAQAPGSFPVVLQVAGTTGGLVQVREAAAG